MRFLAEIIGKGRLLQPSIEAMQNFGAVYLAIVGGAAARRRWRDAGMPLEVPRL